LEQPIEPSFKGQEIQERTVHEGSYLAQSSFFGTSPSSNLLKCTTFWKAAVFPFSGKEASNLVEPLKLSYSQLLGTTETVTY
jgi:hypothetical protein